MLLCCCIVLTVTNIDWHLIYILVSRVIFFILPSALKIISVIERPCQRRCLILFILRAHIHNSNELSPWQLKARGLAGTDSHFFSNHMSGSRMPCFRQALNTSASFQNFWQPHHNLMHLFTCQRLHQKPSDTMGRPWASLFEIQMLAQKVLMLITSQSCLKLHFVTSISFGVEYKKSI